MPRFKIALTGPTFWLCLKQKFYNGPNFRDPENPAIYFEVLNYLSPVLITVVFPLNNAFAYITKTKRNRFIKTI